MDKPKRKSYQLLIILILLFVTPIYLAIWAYRHGFTLNRGTINHGALILPPISANKLGIPNTHKWSLILLAPYHCDNFCQKKLYDMLQIQKACGKNKLRIQRIIITYNTSHNTQASTKLLYPGLHIIPIPKNNLEQAIQSHRSILFAKRPYTIFIADPNGNIMMAYQPNSNPNDIFKDLKHLLRLSQIG